MNMAQNKSEALKTIMTARLFAICVKTLRMLLLAIASALSAASAMAQVTSPKAVRMVIPFPPGGSNDTVARILAPSLSRAIGQTVIVDNRPRWSGIIATSFVARAPADVDSLL